MSRFASGINKLAVRIKQQNNYEEFNNFYIDFWDFCL
jgi:hypothetical protein